MITPRFISIATMLCCAMIEASGQVRTAPANGNAPGSPTVDHSVSAVIETDRVQTLADGNQLEQTTSSKYFRDGKGRVRLETADSITIVDPVSRVAYAFSPSAKTAYRSALSPSPLIASQTAQSPSSVPQSRDLGTKLIDGREATGHRHLNVTPANSPLGNKEALVKVTDIWSAPGLDLPVLITVSDPVAGQITTRYTQIVEHPDLEPGLFEPPQGYVIYDRGATSRVLNNPAQLKALSVNQQ